MGHRLNHIPSKMSGGERQRVAIARALVNRPRLIIADEPTGAVDSENGRRIMDVLKSVSAAYGATLVLVTHDPGIAGQADRIVRFLDGRVAADEMPAREARA